MSSNIKTGKPLIIINRYLQLKIIHQNPTTNTTISKTTTKNVNNQNIPTPITINKSPKTIDNSISKSKVTANNGIKSSHITSTSSSNVLTAADNHYYDYTTTTYENENSKNQFTIQKVQSKQIRNPS